MEEESEFDRDEEADREPSEDELAKKRRVMKNFTKFLSENAPDIVDPALVLKLQTRIYRELKNDKVAPTITALKAFREGFGFGIVTQMNMSHETAKIFAAISKIIADKESSVPKIDISASKPLKDGPEKV